MALPDVVASGMVLMRPLEMEQGWDFSFTVEGQGDEEQKRNPMGNFLSVTPHYFDAIGIELVSGRGFDDLDRETTGPVAIVGRSFAEYLGGIESAVGRRVKSGKLDSERPWMTIVGVVEDARYSAITTGKLDIYAPFTQSNWSPNYLAVRTRGNAEDVVPAVRAILRDLAPEIPLASVRTTADLIAAKLAQPRVNAIVASAFGITALFVSLLGLYSVLSYTISRRTTELGIRMTLGATGWKILSGIAGEAVAIAAIGVTVGLAMVVILGRIVASFLFGVSPFEPWLLTGAYSDRNGWRDPREPDPGAPGNARRSRGSDTKRIETGNGWQGAGGSRQGWQFAIDGDSLGAYLVAAGTGSRGTCRSRRPRTPFSPRS